VLVQIADVFSPRYEVRGSNLVAIDIRGLGRLLGTPRAIGDQMRREAARRGVRAHVAVARTAMAAMILASARPGLTVVPAGEEAAALASVPLDVLLRSLAAPDLTVSDLDVFGRWGIRTLGALAALPASALSARLGARADAWQAAARGLDRRPMVPACVEERFDASLELEWPVVELEPLSFVLTRLLEPLCTRLERRDRGVAVLHVELRLAGLPAGEEPAPHVCRLELPSPIRDVRALRTLALIDLDAHPPAAPVDRVTIAIEPTPGRILQHTLFTRPHPTPEQLSTLLARLNALMGQNRVGRPAVVDSHRPGAFAMQPFSLAFRGTPGTPHPAPCTLHAPRTPHLEPRTSLRRFRPPVPARVAVGADGRPLRVSTDRPGWTGGMVTACAGPWRTSGAWWEAGAGEAGRAGMDRDEWDVALADGAVYRMFQDRTTSAWFIDALVD
jgi:protein ImuB